MSNVYDDIGEELLDLLQPGFGGRADPELVRRVARLTAEMQRLSNDFDYVAEKAGNVREWVAIACSPARRQPWGLEKVETFAHQDAQRLRSAQSLFART